MKPSKIFPWIAGALALVGSVSGCRCDGGTVNKTEAELQATPTSLSFEACPSTDENGNPVTDVFPDVKRFTLANLGKVAGTIATMEITGTDPDVAKVFTIPEASRPASVEGAGSVEIPVHFAPRKRGDIRGLLTLDDGLPDTEPVTVTLIGSGANLPGQPTVKVAFEKAAGGGEYQDCDPYVLANCSPEFPATFYGESSVMEFRVRSEGCPTLKVTGVEVVPYVGSDPSKVEFALESGFVAPTAATPASLNTVDGAVLPVRVAFRPQQDSNFPNDGQRYATLRVTTNDPSNSPLEIPLSGLGKTVTVYASPTTCNFSDPNDFCGFPSKQADKAQVRIGNAGAAPIKVKSLTWTNGGQGGRFSVASPSVVDQVIPVGGSVTQVINHSDAPLFVSDELKILAVDASDATQQAGELVVTFSGGRLPCLETEPLDMLSFQNPTAELTTQVVKIKNAATRNGTACGALVVSSVSVDAPNVFFSVVDPLLPPGTQVPAGGEVSATVQYKKPISGGSQTGILRIQTNDPDFGPEPWKVVTLYSQSPLDQIPVAVLKYDGKETQATVSLGAITGTPKQLQLSGASSYDPVTSGGNKAVAQFQFGLTHKPPNATTVTLENNGLKTAQGTALLTLDPNVATDYYEVQMRVYDDVGQASANMAKLKLYVVP